MEIVSYISYLVIGVVVFIIASAIFGLFFTVDQQNIVVIERLGKFLGLLYR